MPLLSIEDLSVVYRHNGTSIRAVDQVSLTVEKGEVLAVVGESGCGKTSLALAITRLIQPPGEIETGRVVFQGHDLLKAPPSALRGIRGRHISYVFQDPATALNPVLTVGAQLREVIQLHTERRGTQADAYAVELLSQVGIPSPSERLDAYPHELSGGMRQRAMIAMAIASRPSLLIADEPTTALDVTVQVEILRLLKTLQETLGLSVLLISHDLTVVERICHRIAVMYAGKLVELGPVEEVFSNPAHPYTMGLLACRPTRAGANVSLAIIPGHSPDLAHLPSGCPFHPRCPVAIAACADVFPSLDEVGRGRTARCLKPFSKPDA